MDVCLQLAEAGLQKKGWLCAAQFHLGIVSNYCNQVECICNFTSTLYVWLVKNTPRKQSKGSLLLSTYLEKQAYEKANHTENWKRQNIFWNSCTTDLATVQITARTLRFISMGVSLGRMVTRHGVEETDYNCWCWRLLYYLYGISP